MELQITLSPSIVRDNDEYNSYPYDYIHPRAAEIVINSLPIGFEVLGLKINKDNNFMVLARVTNKLNGDILTFDNYKTLTKYDSKMSLNAKKEFIKRYLEDNYGDAGPDTWMEGDISFPYEEDYENYELFLDLVSVKFL